MDCVRAVSLKMSTSQWAQQPKKLKYFDKFGVANGFNSNNSIATTLRFFERFDHTFSYVFLYLVTCFLRVAVLLFDAVPVTSLYNFFALH